MKLALVIIGTIILLLVWVQSVEASQEKPPSTAARVDRLEADVDLANIRLQLLEERVPENARELNCDSGEYGEISPQNSAVLFFIRCEKIEPYLEGFRIHLMLANTHQMVFHGIDGELGHGDTAVSAIKKRVPFSSTEAFIGGRWTPVVVTMNPATAKEIRVLRVTFKTKTMSLNAVTVGELARQTVAVRPRSNRPAPCRKTVPKPYLVHPLGDSS